MGEEVYLSTQSDGKKVKKLEDNEDFSIEPGQFAFILTEEEVRIPFDKIGFISIRASVKFLGLVNISGFHIDPGYKGKLIFAVFNAGPSRIHLRRGERVFPLWIADLDKKMQRTEWKTGYDKIPSNMITAISGEFTTAYQLAEQLKTAKADIVELKNFRLYATTIATVALLVLSPYIKSTLDKLFIFQPTQSSTSAPATGNP
ncbi:hypothetical protein X771_13520 [Mesorhizobium sp. LSJC277A00]|nr:hypothetical protein X771_13520 [Mesorhizobium sp. LSJC277A00]